MTYMWRAMPGATEPCCAQTPRRATTLYKRGVPVQNRRRSGDYDPLANSVKVTTMKVSKGLEFPVVAIPGVERLKGMGVEAPGPGEGRRRAGRLRGCCMWRRPGLRRGWCWGAFKQTGSISYSQQNT